MRSMRPPKAGVPMADTMKSKDIAYPALCIASASEKPEYQVPTKKADAMLLKGKMPQYKITQSCAKSQYKRGSRKTSLTEKSSSLRDSSKPARSPAYLSSTALKTLQTKLPMHKAAPSHIVAATPHLEAHQGETISFMTEPARATERLRPRAKATSMPLNQRNSKQFCATCSDSPPRPKRTRPASISAQLRSTKPAANRS
mmetsp:Transcript_37871/g.108883  ORF Transcript_37871/g.108883 Transcript_37871/m.108883 type:complete len:200 (-) Transcript_37871:399-998(-)